MIRVSQPDDHRISQKRVWGHFRVNGERQAEPAEVGRPSPNRRSGAGKRTRCRTWHRRSAGPNRGSRTRAPSRGCDARTISTAVASPARFMASRYEQSGSLLRSGSGACMRTSSGGRHVGPPVVWSSTRHPQLVGGDHSLVRQRVVPNLVDVDGVPLASQLEGHLFGGLSLVNEHWNRLSNRRLGAIDSAGRARRAAGLRRASLLGPETAAAGHRSVGGRLVVSTTTVFSCCSHIARHGGSLTVRELVLPVESDRPRTARWRSHEVVHR